MTSISGPPDKGRAPATALAFGGLETLFPVVTSFKDEVCTVAATMWERYGSEASIGVWLLMKVASLTASWLQVPT